MFAVSMLLCVQRFNSYSQNLIQFVWFLWSAAWSQFELNWLIIDILSPQA